MIRGLPQNITEQHVSHVWPHRVISALSRLLQAPLFIPMSSQVQDNITSHSLAARDIRLIRKKDTGIVPKAAN